MRETDVHKEVVEQASHGDPVAVDVLLERHLPALETYVRLRAREVVQQRESCSDICQSVCREVLENLGRFEYRGEAAFRHWLFTTAKSKLVDRLRYWRAGRRDVARERAPAARGDRSEADQSRFAGICARLPTPSQHAIGRERMEQFETAFRRLPEDQQELVTMSRIVGFSHAEIAARLGINEAASRQAVHRALVRLARLLDQVQTGDRGP